MTCVSQDHFSECECGNVALAENYRLRMIFDELETIDSRCKPWKLPIKSANKLEQFNSNVERQIGNKKLILDAIINRYLDILLNLGMKTVFPHGLKKSL